MEKEKIIKTINNEFNKSIKYFVKYLSNIHYGKINTNIIKNINININNKMYNIYELSNINVINKITLKITPYDKKNIKIIKKQLLYSDLGGSIFNKNNDIIIRISSFTQEKRLELIKKIKLELEKIKINLRKIRNKYNNYLKKNLKFSNDEKNNIKLLIQKILNNNIRKINDYYNIKKKNILEI
ncbi:ribosome recycling factor [Candidatus Shikimatogenerans bostrichidophilus]|uniref:ribosome recycling factor n=1 Tax=Candidatus Shikimatogenerans bostrichidophilus TaxID=2943807 RepID=UPI0029671DD1